MPGLDKTGPAGQGSATGKRMGRCKTENTTQTEEVVPGHGRGKGRRLRIGNNSNTDGQGKGMGRKFRGGN